MRKNNKTSKAKGNSKPVPKPGFYTILEGYLHGWAPAKTFESGGGMMLKTSQDIVSDLEDMTDIDTFTVASIMSQLGFRAHYDPDGGPHGWMMRKSPGTAYSISPAAPEEDPEDD